MTLQITQDNRNRFSVLVSNDFYVYIDLDQSTAEDPSETLKEADLDYIFAEVEKYSRELTREYEPNPYKRYGVRESDFI